MKGIDSLSGTEHDLVPLPPLLGRAGLAKPLGTPGRSQESAKKICGWLCLAAAAAAL